MQLVGNIDCFAPGHNLNQQLIREILKNKNNYSIEDIIPENNNDKFLDLIDNNNASTHITCVA
jgi:UDP-3-O-acyl-N-acetylglucosamine deacetylase